MAIMTKQKCFYLHADRTPTTKRGEQRPLVAIGLACALCKKSWLVEIIPAGRRAICEACGIEAYSVKVWYRGDAARAAVWVNKKGYKVVV